MYHLYLQLASVGQKVDQLFHTQADPGVSLDCGFQPLDEGGPKTQKLTMQSRSLGANPRPIWVSASLQTTPSPST